MIYDLRNEQYLLKSDDKVVKDTDVRTTAEQAATQHYDKWLQRQAVKEQITKEVKLLTKSDPDKVLKQEFEDAALYDLKKDLDE